MKGSFYQEDIRLDKALNEERKAMFVIPKSSYDTAQRKAIMEEDNGTRQINNAWRVLKYQLMEF